jgi:hypothetical protein
MDGFVKVWSVPTIANIAAPTTAELNAGTNLGTRLVKDGLQGFAPDTAVVDTSKLSSTYSTNRPGLDELGKGALRFAASDGSDTIRSTFVKYYTTNIVVRRDGHSEATAWASSDKVEVWPVTCGARSDGEFASNELQKFDISVFFSSPPNQNATVA